MSDNDPIDVPPAEPVTAAEPVAATLPPLPTAAPPRKGRKGIFFLGALSGCLVVVAGFVLFGILFAAMSGETASGEFRLSANKIAVVPVEG